MILLDDPRIPSLTTPNSLDAGHVHLWLLNIEHFSISYLQAALACLSPTEKEKWEGLQRGKDTYAAARWLVRRSLAFYTGQPATHLPLRRTIQGKPYLEGSDIQFSLSHSGQWLMLAITRVALIGVDIEQPRPQRDISAIAERYFHPDETAALQKLGAGTAQIDRFYRLWTLKEAFFKALGTGISAGLDKIHFSWPTDTTEPPPALQAHIHPSLPPHAGPWQFQQWQLAEDTWIGLASAHAQPPQLHWLDALTLLAFP